MDSFYALLFSNVVFAALLAILAVVLTKVWRNPQFAHGLWLLVLVKLVTPALVHLPMLHFSFGSGEYAVDAEPDGSHGLNGIAETNATGKWRVQEPASIEASSKPLESEDASRTATQKRQPSTFALAFRQLFQSNWSVWLLVLSGVGTLALTAVAVRRHGRFLRLIAATRAPDTTLIEDAKQVSRQIGLANCPPVRVTDALVCPLVSIGGWKQYVLLPSRLLVELNREQIRSVLSHELAHIRRGDNWIRCFELIVLALFWWNPIAWWSSRRLRQAEEECCDAWVVWAMPECRRSYGQALLRTVEILTEGRIVTPIAGAEFGKHFFARRIEMIMKKSTRHRMPWLGRVAILLVGLTVLPITSAAVIDDTKEKNSVARLDSSDQIIGFDEQRSKPKLKKSDSRRWLRTYRLDKVYERIGRAGALATIDDIKKSKRVIVVHIPETKQLIVLADERAHKLIKGFIHTMATAGVPEWLATSIRKIEKIIPGMTRGDLLKVFKAEGAGTKTQRRYTYRRCSYIKVDVTFDLVESPEKEAAAESPKDRIRKISKPFLEMGKPGTKTEN